ncbi:hypothetical protein C2845_PM01G45170 [Panicum miliaceum]|uniref:Uncharacterized protein n=1 Tax=Panicum miliaceum TaxID=4540 RepID=A0A3L6TNA3_PANMI|nr:hypothetical protein C2845_PM01G45170 [Panicum miliaceum]
MRWADSAVRRCRAPQRVGSIRFVPPSCRNLTARTTSHDLRSPAARYRSFSSAYRTQGRRAGAPLLAVGPAGRRTVALPLAARAAASRSTNGWSEVLPGDAGRGRSSDADGSTPRSFVLSGSDSTVLLLHLIDGTREGDRMREVKTEKKKLTVIVDGVLYTHNA